MQVILYERETWSLISEDKGKVVLVFNQAPRNEDTSESGGTAPHILNLDTIWGLVVNFTPQPLYSQGKYRGAHWIGRWVGLRTCLNVVAKMKNPCLCRKSNVERPVRSLIFILTELP
jgi:hypothetical protein